MKSAHILLVDDNESYRTALQQTLERMGYKVTPSTNGADAIERLMETEFDLVLSDIRMPEVDGIELTRHIKLMTSKLPVILITGFAEIIEARTAYDLGADAFLAKPIDREELSETIVRALGRAPAPSVHSEDATSFCKLGVEDFISGAQIHFNVFIQLGEKKFVKIAHKGEDLSADRIRAFKAKGVYYLFLRLEDFRTYVGFNLALTNAIKSSTAIAKKKKLNLLKHTGEIIHEQINHEGIDPEIYYGAGTFVEAVVQVLAEDIDLLELLDVLNSHTDYIYAHSVAASLYSTMIAQAVHWTLPANRFKVAMGGLLHDIGTKEIPRDVLLKSRSGWTKVELELFESHPSRGAEILSTINSVPIDILQVAKQHHESCSGSGYPAHLRKSAIHPMARLVAVASEFCDHVLRSPEGPGVPPMEAIHRMQSLWTDRFDPEFFNALTRLFRQNRVNA